MISVERGSGMSEELIIRHCSPTLAGLKTANMFSCVYDEAHALNGAIRAFNKRLGKKGLRMIPLRFGKERALIYVYRPDKLKNDLCDSLSRRLLTERGYDCASCGRCIGRLMERIKQGGDFPHEIGLFLGYAPDDVKCFMHDPNEGLLCTGCWRVYANEAEKKRLFARFQKCTEVYKRCFSEGITLERLTVACGDTI